MSVTRMMVAGLIAGLAMTGVAKAATVSSVWTTTVDATPIGGSLSDALTFSFEYDDTTPGTGLYSANGGTLSIGSESVGFTNGQMAFINDAGPSDRFLFGILEQEGFIGSGDVTGTIYGQTIFSVVLDVALPLTTFADTSLPSSLDGLSGFAPDGVVRFNTLSDNFLLTAGPITSSVPDTGPDLTPVPLPASALLLLGGIAGLGFLKRRKRVAT